MTNGSLKTYLNNLTDKPKWNPGQFFFIYKIFLQFLVRSEDLQGGSPEGGREDEVTYDLMVFICGPPPMIHSLEEMLVSVGVQKEKVRYEKWW